MSGSPSSEAAKPSPKDLVTRRGFFEKLKPKTLFKKPDINPRVDKPKEERLLRKGNVTTITTPGGVYTIIYQVHRTSIAELPPGIKIKENEVSHPASGYFFEFASEYTQNPLAALYDLRWNPEYKEVFAALESQKIPIYLGDLAVTDINQYIVKDTATAAIEGSVGSVMVGRALKNLSKKRMSRRDLIKLGVASWLTLPYVSVGARGLSHITGRGRKQSADLRNFAAKVHPESHLLTKIRSIIISLKEEYIMQGLPQSDKKLTTIIGSLHTDIEDEFLSTMENKIAFLKATKSIWEGIIDLESLYKIVQLKFNGKLWEVGEIKEIPELKQLITA